LHAAGGETIAARKAARRGVPKARKEKARTIQVTNPATGKVLARHELASDDAVRAAVATARSAFRAWSELDPMVRGGYLQRFADVLRRHKDAYARTMTQEMGKTIRESLAEVEKCAWGAEFFAENAGKFLEPEVVPTDATRSYVAFHPRGVLGSIMPWNFPMWQIVRFSVPALVAGNTTVVKPSSLSPQCGLNVEAAFQEAGLPAGVFQVLVGDGQTARALVRSDVDMVSLTGSVETGVKVATEAAKGLKKVILELGGSDPFIVAEDADLDAAAKGAVTGRFINCGQSCIAAKRFFVVDAVADEFIAKFADNVGRLRVGDPLDPATDIGPLSSEGQLKEIEGQVKDAIGRGARVHVGGRRGSGPGFFYEPTVLSGITPAMRVLREETFGPVAPVTRVPDVDEAIRLANASEFGLGASLWTLSTTKADDLARRLEAGMVFVNGAVKSDPRMPFGGIKHSGIGRELSRYGLLEMVNIKTVEVFAPGASQAAAQAKTE
jgi:succinate-semialdehyde dehydrogenase/glutarate-semialdehyde dehydrogenase/succinyl-CoA reductase